MATEVTHKRTFISVKQNKNQQKKHWKNLVKSFWFDQTSTATAGSPTVCVRIIPSSTPAGRTLENQHSCLGITAATNTLNVPVNGFDVHLQAVSAGGPMAALLAHKRLLSAMLGCFVHSQLSPSQESFRTLRTLKGRALF